MSRMEKEHGRREDFLRQEISDLQQVRMLCHFKYFELEIREGMDVYRCLICISSLGRYFFNGEETSKPVVPQAYTSKRRILIEVFPVPNAYTKSANACIH